MMENMNKVLSQQKEILEKMEQIFKFVNCVEYFVKRVEKAFHHIIHLLTCHLGIPV